MLKPNDDRSRSSHYRIKDIPSPALSGRQLQAFVKLLESSRLARRSVLNLNNIDALRAQSYSEVPLLMPIPSQAMHDREIQKQKEQPEPRNLSQDPNPKFADVASYRQEYLTGQLSPLDVAHRVLHSVALSNEGPEPLHAIIEVHEKSLLQEAEASRQRYQKGQTLSALDGVPIAVKSEIYVNDLNSRAGTSFLKVPEQHPEATIISRLRAAGALIVGITNMHEIGIGVTGANIHYGVARNPYDKRRHTGGSSSGSAAAVAAGLVPIAIGTDGGGSVRIPSALCGVIGLKPTFSRLSSFGAFPSCVSLCQAGPIARTAVDCALAYQIMAGRDPLDLKTSLQPPPSLRHIESGDDLSEFTAGVDSAWFEHADPEVVAICNEQLLNLQKRGLKVIDIKIPEMEEARVAHFITIAAEMFSFIQPDLARHRADLAPTTRFALALGSELSASDYLKAQRARRRSVNVLEDIFNKVDFIVSPTTAVTAPLISGNETKRDVLDTVLMGRLMRFAQLYNLTGNPAISIPAGYTEGGLPVGIQFAARWWGEAELLRLARVSERCLDHMRPATFWSPWE